MERDSDRSPAAALESLQTEFRPDLLSCDFPAHVFVALYIPLQKLSAGNAAACLLLSFSCPDGHAVSDGFLWQYQ